MLHSTNQGISTLANVMGFCFLILEGIVGFIGVLYATVIIVVLTEFFYP